MFQSESMDFSTVTENGSTGKQWKVLVGLRYLSRNCTGARHKSSRPHLQNRLLFSVHCESSRSWWGGQQRSWLCWVASPYSISAHLAGTDVDVHFSATKKTALGWGAMTSPLDFKNLFWKSLVYFKWKYKWGKKYFLPNGDLQIMLLQWTTQLLFQHLLSSQCYSSFPFSSWNSTLRHGTAAHRTSPRAYSCPSTAVTDKC